MNKIDLFKSIAMLIAVIFMVATKMPDFMKKTSSTQKEKGPSDEIARMSGKIVDVRQAENRTFMQVRSMGGSEFWLSTKAMNAQIGDRVSFEISVPRKDYYSHDLRKHFSEIYVVPYLDLMRHDDEKLS